GRMAHKAERGVFELRQGRVLCVTQSSGPWSAVAAVEGLEAGTLADLRALGAPLHLVVTSHRGRVMGIQTHEGADLALVLDDSETPESILSLAAHDTASGSRRRLDLAVGAASRTASAGLSLARLGGLLPALVAVEVPAGHETVSR